MADTQYVDLTGGVAGRSNIAPNPRAALPDSSQWEYNINTPVNIVTSVEGIAFPSPANAAFQLAASSGGAWTENPAPIPLPNGIGPGDYIYVQMEIYAEDLGEGNSVDFEFEYYDADGVYHGSWEQLAGYDDIYPTDAFTRYAKVYQVPANSYMWDFYITSDSDTAVLYWTNIQIEPGEEGGTVPPYVDVSGAGLPSQEAFGTPYTRFHKFNQTIRFWAPSNLVPNPRGQSTNGWQPYSWDSTTQMESSASAGSATLPDGTSTCLHVYPNANPTYLLQAVYGPDGIIDDYYISFDENLLPEERLTFGALGYYEGVTHDWTQDDSAVGPLGIGWSIGIWRKNPTESGWDWEQPAYVNPYSTSLNPDTASGFADVFNVSDQGGQRFGLGSLTAAGREELLHVKFSISRQTNSSPMDVWLTNLYIYSKPSTVENIRDQDATYIQAPEGWDERAYCDGDTTGWVWTGTPGDSKSVGPGLSIVSVGELGSPLVFLQGAQSLSTEGIPSAVAFGLIADASPTPPQPDIVVSYAATPDVITIAPEGSQTLPDAIFLEGTDLGAPIRNIPISASLNGTIDVQGDDTWNQLRTMNLKIRVKGTSFADLHNKIGQLQRTIGQDEWVLALQRSPVSEDWEHFHVVRSTPFKVMHSKKQLTHFREDFDITLIVQPVPARNASQPIRNTVVDPHSPPSKRWPENWERDGNVTVVKKGAGVWWFALDKSASSTLTYGSNDGSGVRARCTGGLTYEMSFAVMTNTTQSCTFVAEVLFFTADWSANGSHTIKTYDTGWTANKRYSPHASFEAPANTSWAQIRFHSSGSASGIIRVRAITLGWKLN